MNKTRLLLFLTSFVCLWGCQKSHIGQASISGTVYEYGTTVPMDGARAYLYRTVPTYGKIDETVTGKDGKYSFDFEYDDEIEYEVFIGRNCTLPIGMSYPDYISPVGKTTNGADFQVTTAAYMRINFVDTGSITPPVDFYIGDFSSVGNIANDTVVTIALPANIKNDFAINHYDKSLNTFKLYSPKPAPFYAAKGDTQEYTIYF